MDIESIRKKKLEELMRRHAGYGSDVQPSESAQDPLAIADKYVQVVRENLSEKAYERLMNVRMINPNLYAAASYLLYQMKSTGRLQGVMDDKKLKEFLLSLLPKEKETRIIRK